MARVGAGGARGHDWGKPGCMRFGCLGAGVGVWVRCCRRHKKVGCARFVQILGLAHAEMPVLRGEASGARWVGGRLGWHLVSVPFSGLQRRATHAALFFAWQTWKTCGSQRGRRCFLRGRRGSRIFQRKFKGLYFLKKYVCHVCHVKNNVFHAGCHPSSTSATHKIG